MRQRFKNGPSKTCRREPLKNLNGYGPQNLHFKKFFQPSFPFILINALNSSKKLSNL